MRDSHDDGQGASPRRRALRRSGRPEQHVRTDSERINALAAGAHVPVEDVLREVADFRLALETDMIIAAAALDAESPDLLGEVLDGERAELATFHDRVLGRLADAAADDELALRRTRKAPRRRFTATLTAAAALLTVLGVGRTVVPNDARPATTAASNSAALATAQDQYADFSSAVSSQSPGAVRDAATQLHITLQNLIANHAGDPEVARRAAQLLQAEISLLEVRDPAGASAVLAQARGLVTMLQRAAPARVRASVQPLLDAVSKPKPKPSASPSPKKPSPTPAPKPKPSATPTPSSSPTQKGLTDTP
jgi:hypothetical protein